MPCINRTPELLSAVDAARLKGAGGPDSKQRLLQQRDKNELRQRRSDFTKAALSIAKDLQQTMGRLDKLAQRACSCCLRKDAV